MPTEQRSIAMWSGPRNISTAMLRSWENRPDTFVCDEPLYAHYLRSTHVNHPGREEIIAHHETDWRQVVTQLTGPIPHGKNIYYQKHMAHHLLPNIERGWLDKLVNCFLIRNPLQMVASLHQVTPNPTLADTGLPQQLELFHQQYAATGVIPPVVDARDVLENPKGVLTKLCDKLGVAFFEAMLAWPSGPRETDGIWAKHWYDAVIASTGFGPYAEKAIVIPDALRRVVEACEPIYAELHRHRVTAAS